MKITFFFIFIMLANYGLFADMKMSDYKDYLEGKAPADWSGYPTYDAYVGFLEKWEQDFPNICKVYDLGTTVMGTHNIYAVRISDNVGVTEGEARYLETNTINGDELLNYLNCLHMIDTLLNSYAKGDARVDRLVNNIDFWFIPNLNPDGTYHGGDNTVAGARRFNADNFDLNRNWPCPCGIEPCATYGIYDRYAKETEILLNLHKQYSFNLMLDVHSGTEVVIWPYGSFPDSSGEVDWYKWTCKRIAGQVHEDCNHSGYMASCGDSGVIHDFEFYESHGTRSDYCNWHGHGKCIRVETEHTMIITPPPRLVLWGWLRESLFQYYELLFTGVQGIVTDSITGKPIYKVKMNRNKGDVVHPKDEYERCCVYSDSAGFYLRFTIKGTWDLTFSHDDYITKTISNITVDDYSEMIELDVQLVPKVVSIKNGLFSDKPIIINSCPKGVRISCGNYPGNMQVNIIDLNGRLIRTIATDKQDIIVWNGIDNNNKPVSDGCYIVQVQAGNKKYYRSFMFLR